MRGHTSPSVTQMLRDRNGTLWNLQPAELGHPAWSRTGCRASSPRLLPPVYTLSVTEQHISFCPPGGVSWGRETLWSQTGLYLPGAAHLGQVSVLPCAWVLPSVRQKSSGRRPRTSLRRLNTLILEKLRVTVGPALLAP